MIEKPDEFKKVIDFTIYRPRCKECESHFNLTFEDQAAAGQVLRANKFEVDFIGQGMHRVTDSRGYIEYLQPRALLSKASYITKVNAEKANKPKRGRKPKETSGQSISVSLDNRKSVGTEGDATQDAVVSDTNKRRRKPKGTSSNGKGRSTTSKRAVSKAAKPTRKKATTVRKRRAAVPSVQANNATNKKQVAGTRKRRTNKK